jgi:hypothetical protein
LISLRFKRQGFALLAVLWIIVALGVLGITASRAVHRAVASAEGERDRVAGRWVAEGCIARLRAASDAVLSEDPYSAAARWSKLDSVVGVDSVHSLPKCDLSLRVAGRPVLGRASAAELGSLPGMTNEAVAIILRMRGDKNADADLALLAAQLSRDGRAIFDEHYAELTRRLAIEPDAWVVRSRAHLGVPPTPVNIEAWFIRGGTRAALVRWVEW